MPLPFRRTLTPVLLLATAVALPSCKQAEEPGHTPATARLFNTTGGAELTPNVQLPSGATTRVTVRFYASDGDLITGIDDHFTALTFNPGGFATVTAVAGQVFQRDVAVAAAAAATAQLTIGYGHDVMADELTFGPITVTATAAGSARR